MPCLEGLPAARSSVSPAAWPCKEESKLAELALWSRLSKTAEIINTFAEAFSMGNDFVILPHFFCSLSQASFHHSLSTTIWGQRGSGGRLVGNHEEGGFPWIYCVHQLRSLTSSHSPAGATPSPFADKKLTEPQRG